MLLKSVQLLFILGISFVLYAFGSNIEFPCSMTSVHTYSSTNTQRGFYGNNDAYSHGDMFDAFVIGDSLGVYDGISPY